MGNLQVLPVISIWAIPVFFLINIYLKTDKEEKKEFKNEIKSPSFFILSLYCIGLLLFHSGQIATVKFLQHLGASIVFISFYSGCIANMKKNVKKSVALMFLGVIGIVTYIYIVS